MNPGSHQLRTWHQISSGKNSVRHLCQVCPVLFDSEWSLAVPLRNWWIKICAFQFFLPWADEFWYTLEYFWTTLLPYPFPLFVLGQLYIMGGAVPPPPQFVFWSAPTYNLIMVFLLFGANEVPGDLVTVGTDGMCPSILATRLLLLVVSLTAGVALAEHDGISCSPWPSFCTLILSICLTIKYPSPLYHQHRQHIFRQTNKIKALM